jgi:hypothetical protein
MAGDAASDSIARAHGDLLALQRLFAFVTLTRRRIVAPTDVEIAFGLANSTDGTQIPKEVPQLNRLARAKDDT